MLEQTTPAHETKSSDTVETSVTNGAADDAIDNTKDDDKDDDNSAAEESPSAPAEEDSADAADDAVIQAAAAAAAAASSQRVKSDVIQQLATSLTDSWMKLAAQLNFQQDDITYFESENSTPAARATNMLTVWTVSTCFHWSDLCLPFLVVS